MDNNPQSAQVDSNTAVSHEPATTEKERGDVPSAAAIPAATPLPVVPLPKSKKGRGLFSRGGQHNDRPAHENEKRDSDSISSSDAKGHPAAKQDAATAAFNKAPAPIGFLDLFRYATKKEITMDILGLICAAGAGATQVRVPSRCGCDDVLTDCSNDTMFRRLSAIARCTFW